MMKFVLHVLTLLAMMPALNAQNPVKPVELVGKATSFHFTRNYNSYYWREDFTFLLKDEKTDRTWRILSREPTPAYDWRMGTTFTGLKPDWKKEPRVKIVGVTGIDRLPAKFYDFKLDEPLLATAHVVWVETPPGQWKEYCVNNWFHKWSLEADPVIYSHFADKKAPHDIYGFVNGQSAPFSKKARDLIDMHKAARMFHGVIRTAKDQAFGYEIDLLHLVGPDKGGNGVVFFGDPKTLVGLEKKK